jgi:arsenate reductase
MSEHVLFLCVANSARSQIAEGIARKLAPEGVTVHSAGSQPGRLNPLAVRVMAEIGIDLSGHLSKGLGAVPIDAITTVITLCAEEVCPAFPRAVEKLHWPLPDPAAVAGDDEARLAAFRAVRDELKRRLLALWSKARPSSGTDPRT